MAKVHFTGIARSNDPTLSTYISLHPARRAELIGSRTIDRQPHDRQPLDRHPLDLEYKILAPNTSPS